MKKCFAVLLAFLLTGSLVLFGMTFLFRSVAAPAISGGEAAADSGVAAREEELIRDSVRELAGLYGFSADAVLAKIDTETVLAMNRQANAWWRGLLKDGKAGEEPLLDTAAITQVLREDPGLKAKAADEEDAAILADEAATALQQRVLRIMLPVRLPVFRRGLLEAGNRIDIPNFVSFFAGAPGALLALSALLAGLIALLESRRLRAALSYIGSAMGGAALVLLACLVLFMTSGMQALIREASESLAVQYGTLASGITLRLGILTAVLLAGCIILLIAGGKNGKKHEA